MILGLVLTNYLFSKFTCGKLYLLIVPLSLPINNQFSLAATVQIISSVYVSTSYLSLSYISYVLGLSLSINQEHSLPCFLRPV